ncbi:hypothetical protein B5S28_g4042 [[Candida] boidinii]|nr:hypothetical protein B5S28_g4042 [[Candida] boidinii]OWB72853.1 hypothetical protein B5S31_g2576 [[Candida] boidinii]OWB78570.1 hypothetical protein B5S32_g2766 [[Candida] boidinii]
MSTTSTAIDLSTLNPNLSTLPPRNPEHNPLFIFQKCKEEKRPVFIAGPMVRYSKLPFREICRYYKTDIVYTPMILAREFVRNEVARLSDFSTNEFDRSVIVQIGANNVTDLIKMVDMIHPYVDGIGLNCGCPIKEQVREGIGAALMSEPEKVSEMVKAVKEKYGDKICIETKIRVHNDINETIRFVKMVEDAGVDFITVHGRTKNTRSSIPADFDKIKIIKESVSVPVVSNGDCRSLDGAYKIAEYTGCDGVMAVRGVLDNPAMFAGFEKAPWGAIERFWELSTSYGLPFRLLQHHLSCMLEGQISRKLHIEMNSKNSLISLIEFFDSNFHLKRLNDPGFGESISIPLRQRRESNAHI